MTQVDMDILIVDDSPIIRRFIRKALGLAGVESVKLHEAENGQVALDYVKSNPVDMVFLDLNMPVMDGETFLRILRGTDEFEDLPVVLVSTECNAERLKRIRELGVRARLRKPFEPERLRELVVSIMEEIQ